MIFDNEKSKQIEDIAAFEKEIEKTSDKFHPKSTEQLEWMLSADGSEAITETDNHGDIIGMLLVSNKRTYQEPVETYGFLKFLIGSHAEENKDKLPSHPDIFWLECAAVDESHRRKGLAKKMVEKAIELAGASAKESPCVIACGIMTENVAAQALARSCGFEKIERDWTQEDFSDDGSYDRDFAWNIFYKIV